MGRVRKKKGIAIIIALFTVFAILTMGVTYIGLSFTNSRATSGHQQEAMIINFANAGIDFAINYMGRPSNWDEPGRANILKVQGDTPGAFNSKPWIRVINLESSDELAGSCPSSYVSAGIGRVIETPVDTQYLADLGVKDVPGMFGHWRILVVPEDYASGGVSPKQNINYRLVVRARILNTQVTDNSFYRNPLFTKCIVASREVMARVSNEFPGSIYKNIRSYDACGGFHYPNYQEYTADAVFAAEDFNWDGQIRVDGTTDTDKFGRPQKYAVFDPVNGWADDGTPIPGVTGAYAKDTSGSINTQVLDSSFKSDDGAGNPHWPKFNGKATVKQNGNDFNEPAGTALGIHYDTQGMEDKKLDVFTNTKDPFQTNSNPLDIMQTIWTDFATGTSKLSDSANPTSQSYLEQRARGGGRYFEVTSDQLVPDKFSAYEKADVPLVRISVIPYESGGNEYTRYVAQKCVRDADPSSATYGEYKPVANLDEWTSNPAENPDFTNNLIYVKGGNVQIFGGRKDLSNVGTSGFDTIATNGAPDNNGGTYGHLTSPLTVVADSNPQRDHDAETAVNNRPTQATAWSPTLAVDDPTYTNRGYDAWLNTANVWDTANQRYLFQNYDNGNRVFPKSDSGEPYAVANDYPIWEAESRGVNLSQYLNDPNYVVRFPPTPQSVNQQPEGNLAVIGDLVQRNGVEPPPLGLVAKNHVLLNDYNMVGPGSGDFVDPDTNDDGIIDPGFDSARLDDMGVGGGKGKQVLDLTATVASRDHSMQMDFFNVNANPYGKPNVSSPSLSNDPGVNKYSATYAPPGRETLYKQYPCIDGADEVSGMRYKDKWNLMPQQAKMQLWWDFNYGSDQTTGNVNGAMCHNYNTLFQGGKFRFVGSIISTFSDVEADAKGPDPNNGNAPVPGLGYIFQNLSYDTNLVNHSAPYMSTSSYQKSDAKDCIYWTILTFVDKGALSETVKNL